jgi:hypothetical protein
VRKATARLAVAAAAAAVVAGAGSAVPAAAAPKTLTGKVTHYERATLRAAGSVGGKLRQKMDTAKVDYLDLAARHGQTVDARTVSVFTDPASSVVLAVGPDTVVDRVNVGTVDGVARGVGVETHEAGSGSTASAPVMGFAGEPTTDGFRMAAAGSHIVTKADDADIQPTQHYTNYLKSWYWKYELPESSEQTGYGALRSGSDFWVYARRGDANAGGANGDLYSSYLDDLTIRARPWGGTSGNFKQILAKAPTGTSSACSSKGTVEITAGPYSVELPQNNCSNVVGLTSVNSPFEFGADWSGSTQGAVSIEAIASFRVVEGRIPSFADYIWADFWTVTAGYPHGSVKWTDTGW